MKVFVLGIITTMLICSGCAMRISIEDKCSNGKEQVSEEADPDYSVGQVNEDAKV